MSEKEPCIQCDRPFDWSLKSVPIIVDQCKQLMNKMKSCQGVNYQLQLIPNKDGQWELLLKWNSVDWYDYYVNGQKTQNVDKFFETARDYVKKLRADALARKPHHPVASKNYVSFPPKSPEKCNHDKNCSYSKCKYFHEEDKQFFYGPCTASLFHLTEERKCGWVVPKIACVKLNELFNTTGEFDKWILRARNRPFRSLLLTPNPSNSHVDNEFLVIDPEFWKTVIKVVSKLAEKYAKKDILKVVERIVMNFGLWELERNKNEDLKECHGHIHFELTLDFVSSSIAHKELSCIHHRIEDPLDYLLEDANCLERDRLNGGQIQSLTASVNALQADVNTLRADVNTLRADVNTLQTSVNTIQTSVDNLPNLMQNMLREFFKNNKK